MSNKTECRKNKYCILLFWLPEIWFSASNKGRRIDTWVMKWSHHWKYINVTEWWQFMAICSKKGINSPFNLNHSVTNEQSIWVFSQRQWSLDQYNIYIFIYIYISLFSFYICVSYCSLHWKCAWQRNIEVESGAQHNLACCNKYTNKKRSIHRKINQWNCDVMCNAMQ